MHRRSRTVAALIAVLAALAAVPSSAGAVVIGIGDQNPWMFGDARFFHLGIKEVRLTVPWDVAIRGRRPAELRHTTDWLKDARIAGVTPLVSFSGLGNYIPTVRQYTNAIRAFLHRFPTVKRYTAWNEPDWIYRSISRHPRLAADFYNALHQQCRRCTVLAGDLYLPAPQLGPWLRAYRRWIRYRPAGWALHNYNDVRTHTDGQLRTMLSLVRQPIWLDETGGVERRGHWPYPNQSAAAAARDEAFLLGQARRYRRVSRIYHYMWQGFTWAGWDSGLIGPNGRARPAFYLVAKAMHPAHRR